MSAFDASALTTINQTALLVVLRRAAESLRTDALFHDAAAERIAALLPELSMSETFWRAAGEMEDLSGDAVALRTRYFDDRIVAAVRAGARQIVTLGAGLDGRPLRLDVDAGTRFFVVDQPSALAARETLLDAAGLEPKYGTRSIAADFAADGLGESLRRSGFRPDAPAVFVAEGLLFYLPLDVLERFLADLGSVAAPGSLLLADFPADRGLGPQGGDPGRTVTADFDQDPRADPWTLFESRDWLLDCRTLTRLARTHGRSLPEQVDELRGGARWWYAAAVRA